MKKFEEFKNKEQYIEYLETNGLISNGCARCMVENGICEDATRKYADREEFLYDTPFSYMEDDESFPVSCLTEWYGKDYVRQVRLDAQSTTMTLHDILNGDFSEMKAQFLKRFEGIPGVEEMFQYPFWK